MKIEYQTTIDEMVTTQMYWLRNSGVFGQWVAWGALWWVSIGALVFYFAEGPLINRLLVSVIFGGIVGGTMIFGHKSMIRQRMRKVFVRRIGSDQPIPATILLDDGKIEYRADNVSIAFRLEDLARVEEPDDGIFLDFARGNVLFIPNSAFTSQQERGNWKSALKGFASELYGS